MAVSKTQFGSKPPQKAQKSSNKLTKWISRTALALVFFAFCAWLDTIGVRVLHSKIYRNYWLTNV
jgi:C-8 sterol isomerase